MSITFYDLGRSDVKHDTVREGQKPTNWTEEQWTSYWSGVEDEHSACNPDIASSILLGNYDG